MRALALLLVAGCSSAPFESADRSLEPDAGALLERDAGAAFLPTVTIPPPPWRGMAGASAGGSSSSAGESSSDAGSVAGAPAGGSSSSAGGRTSDADAGDHSDGGAAPQDHFPEGYIAHRDHLEASGYTCPTLENAVNDCCNSPAAVFACDADGCQCGAQRYGAMTSLCTIAPATPLQWVCP